MTTEAPADNKTANKTFKDLVPQEYHDRGYLKDFLDKEQNPETLGFFFKKVDHLEKIVGKKTGIPEPDAPESEWDAFHAKLRPAKEDEYELVAGEGGKVDEKFGTALRRAFHKAGLTKGQGKKVQAEIIAAVGEEVAALEKQVQEQKDKEAQLDTEFKKLTEETFSEKSGEVLGHVKEMLKELTPANLKPHLERLPNESLVVLAGVLNNVRAKYIVEDGAPGGGGNRKVEGGDVDAMVAEMHKIQSSESYGDYKHAQHKESVARVQELAKLIAKAREGR